MTDACRTSTMVTMTLSDLLSTDTGVHEHRTISTVVEIVLVDILGTEACCTPYTTVKTTLSDLPSTETGVHKHRTACTVVNTDFSTFLVLKHTCTTSTGPR